MLRLLLFLTVSIALLHAHPMGNFSVSHYTRIEPSASGFRGVYTLDLAELPSMELLRLWKLNEDAAASLLQGKAEEQAREWVSRLRFAVDGKAVAVAVTNARLIMDRGAGNMPVLRISCAFDAQATPGVLTFEDPNYSQSNGWKEIVIAGAGVRKASHGDVELSKGLTAYPENVPTPPQDLRARVEWGKAPAEAVIEKIPQPVTVGEPSTPRSAPAGNSNRLSQLIAAGDFGPFAFLLAFVLGCAHAFTPGHGKTMVAAYLVGERGTAWQAVLLGLVVTVTHTLSVFALGIGMYFFAGKFAPERVTILLEFVSGISIVILGCWLLYKRLLELSGRAEHGHSHELYGGGSLWAMGFSGGLVPCPSALVLLLASISLGRVGAGLMLLVLFSFGLASVLVGIGLLVVSGKRLLPSMGWLPVRYLPVASAVAIVVVGIALTATALQTRAV